MAVMGAMIMADRAKRGTVENVTVTSKKHGHTKKHPQVAGTQAREDTRQMYGETARLFTKDGPKELVATKRVLQYGGIGKSGEWEHPDYYHKPKAVWRASLAPKPAPAAEPQRVARSRTGPAPPALRNTRRYASALGGGTIRQPKLKRGG